MNDEYEKDDQYWKSLENSLAESEKVIPPEEYSGVKAASEDFHSNMHTFADGELLYGSRPETWKAYEPQHQEITDSIKTLNNSYQENQPVEVKQAATEHAIRSFGSAGDFFRQEYEKLVERDRKMQEEMAAIRKQLTEMKETMQQYSPDEITRCIAKGMQFIQMVDDARQQAQQKKAETAELFKNTCGTVHSVYKNIKEAPGRLAEAVKAKTYDVIDRGLRHVAGWFDKGIQFLGKQKESVLNLSPIEQQAQQEQKEQAISEAVVPSAASPEQSAAQEVQTAAESIEKPVETKQAEASLPQQSEAGEAMTQNAAAVSKDDVVHLEELLHGDSKAVIQKMVDYMVADGHKEKEITQAFSDMKAAAITIMKEPAYKKIQENMPENSR